jgi:hypothetical protein
MSHEVAALSVADLVLMTRKDLDADSLKAMLVWLAKNGYDYSMLTRVEQGGCR